MPSANQLQCPSCGAPVDALARACSYCRSPLAPTEEVKEQEYSRLRKQRNDFLEALRGMLTAKTSSRDALLAASAAHFDEPLPAAAINATLALASDFERSSRCSVHDDPDVLCRLLDAYQRARTEVASAGSSEINIPFLSSGPAGPAHLNLRLDRASLAALEARA